MVSCQHFEHGYYTAYRHLAELAVLDIRQYRDDQPCDGNGVGRDQVVAGCRERLDPGRTLLGTQQRRWLLAGLDRSGARWNVVAQQPHRACGLVGLRPLTASSSRR